MKVLAGGRIASNISAAISYLKERGIQAVNLGVETPEQAKETFEIAREFY